MRTSRMRTTRALAVTMTAGAVLGLAAPTASAWADPSNIVAMPSVIPRGGQLTVTVDGTACHAAGSKVTSDAFPDTPLKTMGGGTASANPIIHQHASPGAHSITVHCGTSAPLTKPNAFTVIHGGVRGGLGGSSSAGATGTDMAIGGALVAAAVVGGGVFWMRRRSENAAGRGA